jgi:Tol biopolymer transport system component
MKRQSVVTSPAYEGGGVFSPDDRWMAYAPNESGQIQVYLRPSPGCSILPIERSPPSRDTNTSRLVAVALGA